MGETLELWLPKPPDNANTKLHHMQMVRMKNAYKRELAMRAGAKLIPAPPPTPWLKSEVLIEWHYPNRRHLLDDDNAIRRLKPAIDWLRESGYIAGDTSGHLRIFPVETRIGDPTPPLSTVRLTLTRVL